MVPGTRETRNEASWDGRVDELGIWKRALTVQERAELYNSGRGNTFNTNRRQFEMER